MKGYNASFSILCYKCMIMLLLLPLFVIPFEQRQVLFTGYPGVYKKYCDTPGFTVAQDFNSMGHSISDVLVQGMALCNETNIQ